MRIQIGLIGLGYVGLPLSLKLGKHFKTIGYDIDKKHIALLKKNKDKNNEIRKNDFLNSKKIKFTDDFNHLADCNIYIIALPTPLNKNKKPDISNIINFCKKLSKHLNKNDTIVFESSFYPGTINNILVPLIEKQTQYRLIYNKNIFIGYSPERINPGLYGKKIDQIKKIISASNKKTLDKLFYIYSKITKKGIHKAKDIKVAEASKMLENVQRDVNIGLINEFSMLLNKLNINLLDTLTAAETKWNYHKYRPGLVGGHCIGVDTNYLIYASKEVDFNPKILNSVRQINDNMPKFYAHQIIKNLKNKKLNIKKTNALIMGFTFKENCSDIRNTKVYDLYLNMLRYFNRIDIYDSFVNKVEAKKEYNLNIKNNIRKNFYEVIIIAVPHNYIKKLKIAKIKNYNKKNIFIFDLKYAFSSNSVIHI